MGIKHGDRHNEKKERFEMLERKIEKYLVEEVKRRGGSALKFISPGYDGVPDRVVLLPKGKIAFVELKAPGKILRPLQMKRKKDFEELGQRVFVVDQVELIGGILDEIQTT